MKIRVIRRVAGEHDVVQTHAVVEQPGLHLVNLAHVALQQQLFTQAAAKAREALCLKGLSPEVQGLAETIVVAADYGVALEQALIELKELSERPSNPTRRIAASLHRRLARFRVRW